MFAFQKAAGESQSPRPPAPRRRSWRVLVGALLTLLALVVAACGGSTGGTGGTSTATPGAGGAMVKVFFTRHPDSDTNPVAVFAVTRPTTATTTQERATFALEEMLKGPSAAERTQGYYSPFDGQLALQSYCSGPFRDFDLTLDHKGTLPESGTATLQFCRRVDIPGDLDGPRMATMVTSTLAQFAAIQRVVILTYQGSCFDDMQGRNACLDGKATGYPVQVFFSKHPETDNNLTAVFPVTRISPDLGVATYAVKQLIAGPTAAEKQAGYFSELAGRINASEASTCNGADFTIALNTRGAKPEAGTATLQFCRTVTSGGVGDDARMLSELRATLTQFETIQRAVILTRQGNCLGDMSGRNFCLNPGQAGYPVKVYYSKHPDSDTAPTKVFAVSRIAPDLGVATFAMDQLIAGPTAAEKAQGYYSPLTGALSGTSTCNSADFKITLNWNRNKTEMGPATLQFCRDVRGLGDTGSAIVRNEITKTLTQFASITKVVIVKKDGACFDDLIGCS